jgi:replication factor C subunit 3/5
VLELKNVVFGVTSTIFAFANKVYGSCYQNMVLDLNAGDDMGIHAV